MTGTSRTVQLNIIGDSTKAQRSFTDLAGKADDTGEQIKGSFNGALDVINQTGILGPFGNALDGITDKIAQLGDAGLTTAGKLTAIGLGVGAIGFGLTKSAGEDKQALEQLKASIAANGGQWDDWKDSVASAAAENRKKGISDKDTYTALQVLTTGLQDNQKALAQNAGLADLAAGGHMSLADAANTVDQALHGHTKGLGAFGVVIKDTTAEEEKLAAAQRARAELMESQHEHNSTSRLDMMRLADANKKVADAQKDLAAANAKPGEKITPEQGVAEAYRRNLGQAEVGGFKAKYEELKVEFEHYKSEFGQTFGPALSAGGTAVGLASLVQMTRNMRALTAATKAAALAQTAELAPALLATEVVAAPIEIPLLAIGAAVLGIGIAGYELHEHWDAIWGGVKKGAEEVVHVIERVGQEIEKFLLAPLNAVIHVTDKLHLTHIGHIGPGGSHAAAVGTAALPVAAALPAAGAGGGGDITVHSHVHLDGKKVGEGVAKHTRGQLLRDQRGTVNTGLA